MAAIILRYGFSDVMFTVGYFHETVLLKGWTLSRIRYVYDTEETV